MLGNKLSKHVIGFFGVLFLLCTFFIPVGAAQHAAAAPVSKAAVCVQPDEYSSCDVIVETGAIEVEKET